MQGQDLWKIKSKKADLFNQQGFVLDCHCVQLVKILKIKTVFYYRMVAAYLRD